MRKFPGVLLASLLAVASIPAGGPPASLAASASPATGIASDAGQTASRHVSRRSDGEPTLRELQARLDMSDQVAALSALQMALNRTADGNSFIWHKSNHGLKGIIKPTTAFRNANGQVCRHVIYAISLGRYRKQIELIACREAGGRWRL